MSIFDEGAAIVPDIVTEAEERRILMRIADAPWLTDLSRRVQHYGYRYAYRNSGSGWHAPAPAFPRWAVAMADRMRPLFDGGLPEQCIVNEYRPGQGIGMHADHASFGPVVVSLSLAADWPMHFRPCGGRPYVRHGLASDELALLPRRCRRALRLTGARFRLLQSGPTPHRASDSPDPPSSHRGKSESPARPGRMDRGGAGRPVLRLSDCQGAHHDPLHPR